MIRRFVSVLVAFSLMIGALALPAPLRPALAQTASPWHEGFAPRPGRRAIAYNLAEVVDWSTQMPFIDLMRSARPWIGHVSGQWGGRDEAELRAAGHLDEDGWVLSVPGDLSMISTLILTEIDADMALAAGRYHARWEGTAQLGFVYAARNVRYSGQSATFDYIPGDGSVGIEFRRGTLRNLTIVHERHLEAFERGEIFNPDWLALIGDAENLRFMDWMLTNNSAQADWSDRPRVSHYTWMERGVPLEVMIELANQTGAEPWFTLPHLATPDYEMQFLQMVRQNLRPDLRPWIEYSNEVWNFMFDQAHWAEDQARARWGREWQSPQFYMVRASELMQRATEVFADQPGRVVRVLGVFTGALGYEAEMLNPVDYLAESPANRPLYDWFDAYAVTGYFGADLHIEARVPMVMRWLAESRARAEAQGRALGLNARELAAHVQAHRFDHAVELAGRELLDGGTSGSADWSVEHLLNYALTHHARVARAHGMEMVMYEGGTHLVTSPVDHGNEELIAFFEVVNYSEPMGQAYRALLQGWQALTPAPFNHFNDVSRPGIWGSWGARRHLNDDSSRWRAIMELTAP
jgi:hypothetical protein